MQDLIDSMVTAISINTKEKGTNHEHCNYNNKSKNNPMEEKLCDKEIKTPLSSPLALNDKSK